MRIREISDRNDRDPPIVRHRFTDRHHTGCFIVIKPRDGHRQISPDRFVDMLSCKIEFFFGQHPAVKVDVYGGIVFAHVESLVHSTEQHVKSPA